LPNFLSIGKVRIATTPVRCDRLICVILGEWRSGKLKPVITHHLLKDRVIVDRPLHQFQSVLHHLNRAGIYYHHKSILPLPAAQTSLRRHGHINVNPHTANNTPLYAEIAVIALNLPQMSSPTFLSVKAEKLKSFSDNYQSCCSFPQFP